MPTHQYNSVFPASHSVINTILIVHDHPIVWHGLRQFLERRNDLEIVGETSTSSEAIQLIDKLQPDAAILDIILGPRKGITLIRKIVQHDGIPVLVISSRKETHYAERVLRAGARGYLAADQDQPFDALLEAIHTVLNGNVYLDDKVKAKLLELVVRDRDNNNLRNDITIQKKKLQPAN